MGVTDAEFRAMLSSPPFLIRRICDSCKESHKDIYYKRLTELPPATELNFLDLFMNNWRSAPKNQLNVDFELYFFAFFGRVFISSSQIFFGSKWQFCSSTGKGKMLENFSQYLWTSVLQTSTWILRGML